MSGKENSSNTHLFCFPDTNFFIQCKSLDQLDWSALGAYETIDLQVVRPVQKEIDEFKGGGNARRSSKARTASALFRDSITSVEGFKEIRFAAPRVRIYVQTKFKPDEKLKNVLNYQESDDQLVGIVSDFLQLKNGGDVLLLTGDTGPMASAKLVDVPFMSTPDAWLLPPEEDKIAKENKKLTQELEGYKKAEPNFSVRWLKLGISVERIEASLLCYSPLTSNEVAMLMRKISQRFPMATSFAASNGEQSSPSNSVKKMGVPSYLENVENTLRVLNNEAYAPATEEDISQYKDDFAKWEQSCEDILKNLHSHLEEITSWPRLSIEIQNIGMRSASDSMITISAHGGFLIFPIGVADDGKDAERITLQPPPEAPKGKWQSKLQKWANLFNPITSPSLITRDYLNQTLNLEREVDSFYFKSSRPSKPLLQYSLECSLWRHQTEAKVFSLTVHPEMKAGEISGVVKVAVYATNLSTAVIHHLPVTVNVQHGNLWERANDIVDKL